MSLTGVITASFSFTQVAGSQPGFVSAKDTAQRTSTTQFSSGTGDGSVDLMLRKEYTVSSGGGTQAIDLVGANTDAFGNTISFAKIKGILVRNSSAVAVSLKPGASSAWVALLKSGSEVVIPAYGILAFGVESGNGHSISAGSDNLLLQNDAGANATVEIIVVGTSA